MDVNEKRRLRAWSSKRSKAQLECRVGRGSHWWPGIASDMLQVEWDPKKRRYNLVGYCQRECGCKVEFPVAKKTGIVDSTGRIIYSEGYQYTAKDGKTEPGPMTVEAKGYLRSLLIAQHVLEYGLHESKDED
jgi:hypothetical protein